MPICGDVLGHMASLSCCTAQLPLPCCDPTKWIPNKKCRSNWLEDNALSHLCHQRWNIKPHLNQALPSEGKPCIRFKAQNSHQAETKILNQDSIYSSSIDPICRRLQHGFLPNGTSQVPFIWKFWAHTVRI